MLTKEMPFQVESVSSKDPALPMLEPKNLSPTSICNYSQFQPQNCSEQSYENLQKRIFSLEQMLQQEASLRENLEVNFNILKQRQDMLLQTLEQERTYRESLQQRLQKLEQIMFGPPESLKEESPKEETNGNDLSNQSIKVLKSWEENFNELKKFKQKHGHCNVPKTKTKRETWSLANWVSMQRAKRKSPGSRHGTLTQEQINKLDDIGFEWDRSYYTFRRNTKESKVS